MGSICTLSACAPGVYGAYQVLTNTARAADAATSAFEKYDHDAQIALVKGDQAEGKDLGAIEFDLNAYRAKRAAVLKAIVDANAVIHVGYTLLPCVEQGIKKSSDLQAWLVSLYSAAEAIYSAIKTFEGP